MATFINQSLEAASITKKIFIFDDANSYFVRATVGDISQNKITFGNGRLSDTVTAAGDISKNTITFGDEMPGSGFVFAGGGLGNTLVQASTTATDLASYISSLEALTNGDTYVGFNQTAQKTFIVTETQSGQMGAVELVGHAFDHNSIAGHVLTLA